jgi:hypothetical protein
MFPLAKDTSHRFKGLQARSEASHGLAMLFEGAVREEFEAEFRDVAESGTSQLASHFFLACIRRNQKHVWSDRIAYAHGEVEQPHNTRVDRGAVLHLECGGDLIRSGNKPKDVNQADRVPALHTSNWRREFSQAAIAQLARPACPPSVVGRYPNIEPERLTEIA